MNFENHFKSISDEAELLRMAILKFQPTWFAIS